MLALQTGLRISELAQLTCADIQLGSGAHVRCTGKGRRQRTTPLVSTTIDVLHAWLAEHNADPTEPLFPTTTGTPLSRDAIERRIRLHVTAAARQRPSLAAKHVTAHTRRHTCAMRLLTSGVDVTVIALWLGHEQVSTTNIYLHADLTQKELAIAHTSQPATNPGRYQAPDAVLAFLDAL